MRITSYLSDETIHQIFDLIEQDINNAIWLLLIKDRDLMEGELSVELKIHRWGIRPEKSVGKLAQDRLIFAPFYAMIIVWKI